MIVRKSILLLVSLVIVFVIYNNELTQNWLNTFIFSPNAVMEEQFAKTGYEERMEYKYQNTWLIVKYIQKTLDTTSFKTKDPMVLFPPKDYLKSIGAAEYLFPPEPSVFYYLSGVKATWTTGKNVENANWILLPSGKESVVFQPIRSKDELHQYLKTFSQFKPSL
ncbi:MAG: hypothetical protein EBX41_07850 [Chitinophagia bacterium]|nr:hypothetical protein [Chitinophagia bacterium]